MSAPSAHPWERFLQARLDVIRWMLTEGDSVDEILWTLAMDRTQLEWLILHILEPA